MFCEKFFKIHVLLNSCLLLDSSPTICSVLCYSLALRDWSSKSLSFAVWLNDQAFTTRTNFEKAFQHGCALFLNRMH